MRDRGRQNCKAAGFGAGISQIEPSGGKPAGLWSKTLTIPRAGGRASQVSVGRRRLATKGALWH
jgi:hypothetical protein